MSSESNGPAELHGRPPSKATPSETTSSKGDEASQTGKVALDAHVGLEAAQPGGGGASRPDMSLHIDGAKVVQHARVLIKYMRNNLGLITKRLADEIGIEEGVARGLLYEGRRRWISADDLTKVVAYARDQATKAEIEKNYLVWTSLSELTSEVLNATKALFDPEETSPTERALVQHLGIDVREQAAFSENYAGVYATLRFTARGYLAVSRLDLKPKVKGGAVCRFTTLSTASQQGYQQEPQVDGYMYIAGKKIYSIGRTSDAGVVRSTILEPVTSRSGSHDLHGLRLAASKLDGEPFAHRIHLRHIGGVEVLGQQIDGWDPELFTAQPYSDDWANKIAHLVTDLDELVELLRQEPKTGPTPWGLKLPSF